MGQGLFPYRYITVTEHVKSWVSLHMLYTEFGVRDEHRHHHHNLEEVRNNVPHRGRFICTGTPGSGFFARDTESDTYLQYIGEYTSLIHSNYFRFLTGKEFSFDRELAAVEAAVKSAENRTQKEILESYGNCLALAKQAEQAQRMIKGVKRQMKSRPTKAYVSALTYLKGKVARLEHELKDCQMVVENRVSREQMDSYNAFCEVFEEVMQSRRIWALRKQGNHTVSERVFWDMGMFDYIRSERDTPVMCDAEGVRYYIFPDMVVRVRSSVDFDVFALKDLDVVYREVSTEAMLMSDVVFDELHGRGLGEVYFSGLDVSFYFAHRHVARKIVDAMTDYKKSL